MGRSRLSDRAGPTTLGLASAKKRLTPHAVKVGLQPRHSLSNNSLTRINDTRHGPAPSRPGRLDPALGAAGGHAQQVAPSRGDLLSAECGTSAPLSAAGGDSGGNPGGDPPGAKAVLTHRNPYSRRTGSSFVRNDYGGQVGPSLRTGRSRLSDRADPTTLLKPG